MAQQDNYEVLGLKKGASADDIIADIDQALAKA